MTTIGLEQIKDCDHCSKTYGTLGCCTTVNNKWVYSCTKGQKEYVIDRVLEIIDKMPNANTSYWNKCDVVDREGLREEILALKEGAQE